MSRFNLRTAWYAALLLAAAGCTQDLVVEHASALRFTGEIPATRTQYTIDEATKSARVEWLTDDEIGIFTAGMEVAAPYHPAAAGIAADFVPYGDPIVAPERDADFYAFYPSGAAGIVSNGTNISLNELRPSTDPAAVDFLYASAKADAGGTVRFRFRHTYAILALRVSDAFCIDAENPVLDKITIAGAKMPSALGGEFDWESQTFIDDGNFTNEISWSTDFKLTHAPTTIYLPFRPRTLSAVQSENDLYFRLTVNGKEYSASRKPLPEGGLQAGVIYRIDFVKEHEQNAQGAAKDREALIAFYNATGGDNWTNNTNWCSDKPLDEWYGVGCTNGRVTTLSLTDNNLQGLLPDKIGDLTELRLLRLNSNIDLSLLSDEAIAAHPENTPNRLTGAIPAALSRLKQIGTLDLRGNRFSSIADGFSELLRPKSDDERNNLRIDIRDNRLQGKIPNDLLHHEEFGAYAGSFMVRQQGGYGLDWSGVTIPAVTHTYPLLGGGTLNLRDEYAKNEFTLLLRWAEWSPNIETDIKKVRSCSESYRSHGFEVIGVYPGGVAADRERFMTANGIQEWRHLVEDDDPYDQASSFHSPAKPILDWWWPAVPFGILADKDGNIVWFGGVSNIACPGPVDYWIYDPNIPALSERFDDLYGFLERELGPGDLHYTSTDFSKDGQVAALQTATQGAGIDIVLIGDGFSDRQIADGTYEATLRKAADAFFTEEPYASFRDRFNVYTVTAVSKNEGYFTGSDTAVSGYFGEGTLEGESTLVGGDDELCMYYAMDVPGMTDRKLDNTLIIVIMNSKTYAGTCYMYYPSANDYGEGLSVAYFPLGTDDAMFAELIHHEAGGHGFAKLADEYYYSGRIPQSEIDQDYHQLEPYGWYRNVDFTSDPASVKWSSFLSDVRYASEGLGVFEGACTYRYGAYRPTRNSIMTENTGGFNAPSREAIYYRIRKLTDGGGWTYDREEFVAWDARNRTAAAVARRAAAAGSVRKDFRPLHPPVVVGRRP